jgi:hypothetical protein
MSELCRLIFGIFIDLVRSRAALEAEIVVLRQQIKCAPAGSSQETSICLD